MKGKKSDFHPFGRDRQPAVATEGKGKKRTDFRYSAPSSPFANDAYFTRLRLPLTRASPTLILLTVTRTRSRLLLADLQQPDTSERQPLVSRWT